MRLDGSACSVNLGRTPYDRPAGNLHERRDRKFEVRGSTFRKPRTSDLEPSSVLPVSSVWFVWFFLSIWLNQTNQTDKRNQMNQTNQIDDPITSIWPGDRLRMPWRLPCWPF